MNEFSNPSIELSSKTEDIPPNDHNAMNNKKGNVSDQNDSTYRRIITQSQSRLSKKMSYREIYQDDTPAKRNTCKTRWLLLITISCFILAVILIYMAVEIRETGKYLFNYKNIYILSFVHKPKIQRFKLTSF